MPIFKNCLPHNRLEPHQIFSVRRLVTHGWLDVGDGIQSRTGEFINSTARQRWTFLFASPAFTERPKSLHQFGLRSVFSSPTLRYGCGENSAKPQPPTPIMYKGKNARMYCC